MAINLEDNLMEITRHEEDKSTTSEVSSKIVAKSNTKSLDKQVKNTMVVDKLTSAILEKVKLHERREVPTNTHLYPRRELVWCSICWQNHTIMEFIDRSEGILKLQDEHAIMR